MQRWGWGVEESGSRVKVGGGAAKRWALNPRAVGLAGLSEREIFTDNLLVRVHLITETE